MKKTYIKPDITMMDIYSSRLCDWFVPGSEMDDDDEAGAKRGRQTFSYDDIYDDICDDCWGDCWDEDLDGE